MSEAIDIAARKSKLSTARKVLLNMRMSGIAKPVAKLQLAPRQMRQPLAPLSFSQQRLWFLDQLEPGNAFYNISRNFLLRGSLDIQALERSLNEIIRRHEILRTSFKSVEGHPVQIISPPQPLNLLVVNLQDHNEEDREAKSQSLITEHANQPFDLGRGPLMRVKLLRLNEQEHVLMLAMHHIVSDGWSAGLFFQELSTLYTAYAAGEESPLAELPVQYADYAVWQREYLSGEVLNEQVEYWRERLTGAAPVLELPADKVRPAVQSYQGAVASFEVSPEVSEGLKELSQREGVTLFMTLLAAFKVLLYRYTGQEDIVVGSPIAGRTRAEVENLIGFFVNTLVLRTDLSGGPTFRELLGRVRDTALGAYAHQDVPFEKLVEELQPERDLSRSPLFQVMFALQNAPQESLRLEGLSLSPVKVETEIAKFDLLLFMGDTEQGLQGALEYSTDLFERETIERLLGHFKILLEAIVREPHRAVTELPLLSEAERHQLLVEWNETEVDERLDLCIHQLFEEQVEKTPAATALVFGDERLSYAELNGRANQLAHHLQSLDVGPEVLVGILMERSVEMVVSLLAVLKAGGAYVPLDPQYPAERVAFMLADTGAPVLLTQQRLLPSLPAHEAQVLCVDQLSQQLATESTANPGSSVESSNLAYVIYTSGSTGRPKGVAIAHRSAALLLCWAARTFSPAELAVTLASTSICFDLSVFELFAPLSSGGRVVLVENALGLAAVSAREGITLVNTVPSAMAELVRSGAVPETVRVVNLAGEALGRRLVEQVYETSRVEAVWNLYGPTEDTTYTTAGLVKQGGERVTIGRAVDGTQLYVLDAELETVPVGVAGELYIGGAGLARGYLGRAELTAERFIADPFGGDGGRLYRTGDLVRYLSDARLEYLGRRDEQVKVRGFRIELGEIAAALQSVEDVKEAVVIVREDAPGEKRLVAYVVPQAGRELATNEIRAHLKQRLPEYMVPSAFIYLDELPLTPNGKLDRKALPAPETDFSAATNQIAPRTPVEEMLCGIWAEVLGVRGVGVDANFFEVGGHSLKATQVISRIRENFQVELPLRTIFEAPTIETLAESIERAFGAGTQRASKALQAVPREGPLGLSFAQQRLWFLQELEPESTAYNIVRALRLRGELNAAALDAALTEIVRRHEALRTRFAVEAGQPVQLIAPEDVAEKDDGRVATEGPPLQERDGQYGSASVVVGAALRGRPSGDSLCEPNFSVAHVAITAATETEREAAVTRFIDSEVNHRFNLQAGSLFRASLLRLDAEEHVLVLAMHHIISDGWSAGVLFRELSALYTAYAAGEESPLPELPVQYADYAVWQREYLSGEVLSEQVEYWRERLAGAAPVLELPADKVRPAVQSYQGAAARFEVSRAVSEALKELSQREGVTLFMTLLAAFKVLLYRYTGQEDIVVGSPIAGRTRAEVENLIGFFVNTLVLRTDLSGGPSFRELLGRVRETALGAYAHQDVPFEKLVEELQPERDLSHTPLFQVLFGLQNTSPEELRLEGLELNPLEVNSERAKFDLTLMVAEESDGLRATLRYNTDLFEAATIERLVGHFQTLLEGILINPEKTVSQLPLLSEAESRQLLVEWNQTHISYPAHSSIQELFEQQVRRTPDAIALFCAAESLSYEELNTRANQLAHQLRSLGVGPEVLVGILMERSVEMVVSLLAVLKAGGAYVPLDPEYPAERLSFMLADAAAPVLLTQKRLLERLPGHDAITLCVDSDWKALADLWPTHNPPNDGLRSNAAYVIYTSGSTGKPKGVVVEHSPICNHLLWRQERYPLNAEDRFLHKASISFDIAVWEIFAPLISGARLVLAEPGGQQDAAYLVRTMAAQQITMVHFGPAMLKAVLEEPALKHCVSLRDVFCGGESITFDLQRRFFERLKARLHHQYGPTETTVDVIIRECRRDDERQNVPIGRPIANTEIYILDEQLHPVPVGVPGQLFVGAMPLARGYLNRPDLTAEKFLPHPFSEVAGSRLYSTGDLARYLPDGEIEFLGRVDNQVKVRGFRIELGEIAAALQSVEDVKEAVVIVREDAPGEKRLVAYVVTEGARQSGELRAHLKQRLPEYMMPSAFIYLDELPLTPNGKVDRKALPAPETDFSAATNHIAPRTPVEEMLCGIWAEVLGVRGVGVDANFFEVGGHSLKATQVISRIRENFQVELPLRTIFEAPTIETLAESIERALGAGQRLAESPLRRVSREMAIPVSLAQQRLWFLQELEPESTAYNIVRALRLRGELKAAALDAALTEIVRRHEALRTRFTVEAGQPVQLIAPEDVAQKVDGGVATEDGQYGTATVGAALRGRPSGDALCEPNFSVAHVAITAATETEREAAVTRFIDSEVNHPFNLQAGSLFRASLLRLEAEEHVLVLAMHHIISDGWSAGVLFRELSALYTAYAVGEDSPLPELPVQYADYAVWQREYLSGEVLSEQVEYWRERLAGAAPVLELPADKVRPAVQSYQGAAARFEVSREVSEALKELSQREGVTLFMTLLAAFKVLLYRYTGQADIVVGSPIAGRTRAEVENLIGFFVNTLVLRTDLSGAPGFRELLGRVRETALAAYAHQDVPFEKLVEELQPERDLSHTPLFQVLFVLQNALGDELRLPDLSVSPVKVETEIAKFDLSLFIMEQEGGLKGALVYSTDLFERESIERLLGHFKILLEAIVNEPQRAVTELPLLSEAERHQLLVEWNETEVDERWDGCIHQLFEEQVEKTPAATALVFGDERLSYAELNGRANQLAHHLQSLGVGPEVLVGILMERSVEMVVSLLAVLKAGGAYVPLDPQYPAERLAFMLADTGAPVLLTQQHLLASLPAHEAQVLCVDQLSQQLATESTANPGSSVKSSNLAYVIYTSGSTGRPKGVAIAHRSAALLLRWAARTFSPAELAVTLASTSICFDLSVFELFAPLSSGGRVVLVENALGLAAVSAREGITLVNTVPSAMAELVRSGAVPETVRVVNLAGEALGRRLVEQVYETSRVEAVWNLYGPTEDTTYTTAGLVKRGAERVTIGRAVDGTQLYVLDAELEAVPVGVAGELYIGGAGLARGYLGRAELTAERFIADPFGGGGGRLYRTGDLVRYLSDARLEYLGRRDEQVKVRGFRIELGEIAAALQSVPDVKEAVVVVREDAPGEKRLVAYVVPQAGRELATNEIRAHLKRRLPEYMMPSAFIYLDELPLTPNGKVDRKALPAPETDFSAATNHIAPRTPVEEMLCGIWAEVLGVRGVGVDANFFEVGGHSLKATQVISRIRENFQVELPLRTIFEAPTIETLAESIERALGAGTQRASKALQAVPREGPLGLSFAQQRLWFLQELEPESTAYNIVRALRLRGELKAAALDAALTEIVRRHEALRTRFAVEAGQPVQLIAPEDLAEKVDGRVATEGPPLQERDGQYGSASVVVGAALRGRPWGDSLCEPNFSVAHVAITAATEAEREAAVTRFIDSEVNHRFNLQAGSLFRASLLRLDAAEHVLVLAMHHIISDGWSAGVLFRELSALYTAYAAGEESPLPELPVQYADYAVWQREYLSGEVLNEQVEYWRERLAGAAPVLELPADKVRPAVQSYQGAAARFEVSPEVSEALKELSQREGVTLFMTLLAAFKVLLYRYTGQADIVVGSPIAGRTRAEVENLIGFFVNTLVLRTDLSGAPGFRELLGRVRETALAAYAHQDVPFEKLVEELQPARDLSHTPLFQVLFVLQNALGDELRLPDLSVSPVKVETEIAKFDLSLFMLEQEEGLKGVLVYSTDLFERETIERLLGHFKILLEAIVREPQRAVTELPLLSEAERHQLLVEWNETEVDERWDGCIHQLFEEQAARTPAATSLVFEDERLSYAELNGRANQLAHHLQSLGVGPEVLVGILMERSVEMVVSLLAVLKAGGAYVPLDPQYPAERLAFMLEDTGAPVLLTQQRLLRSLPAHEAQVLCVDQLSQQLATESTANPGSSVKSSNLAYVIYTSGSTGRPKGVAIAHCSAALLLCWAARTFSPAELAVTLASTSICFDLSVFELFAPLSSGGRVVLVENALGLGAVSAREGITLVNTVPSAMAELVRSSAVPETVRVVNLAGEALGRRLVEQVYEASRVEAVWNLYGPTEDTTYTTAGLVKRGGERVTIGRAVDGTQLYVLDAELEAVPVGVAGELYIGGAGLARGYLGRAELTAERFIADPFGGGGRRLYRTGDLVRYLGDGSLEYLGRRDEQVKVRGFRIELGEIAAALQSVEDVKEAVVIVREDAPGEKRLVAYVVTEGARQNGDLRAHLKQRLPEYMMPSAFIYLDELPLTPNGKVDRKALPAPETDFSAATNHIAPRTPVEEMLCGIWAEVLGVRGVGVDANFFEVGGHSLKATQVISRIRENFQVELPLRTIFEAPTIETLAESIERALGAGTQRASKALQAVPREGPLGLSFAQQRLWFLQELEPESTAYNIVRALRLRGELKAAALDAALTEIVRRHEALRTRFAVEAGQPVQLIAEKVDGRVATEGPPLQERDGQYGSANFSVAHIAITAATETEREAAVTRFIDSEVNHPFNLQAGSLFRATLLRLEAEEHVLVLTTHHIISDGWSAGVLFRELSALYTAYAAGEESPLAELPVQYADFAVWQRAWLQGEVLEQQLVYWRERLTGAAPVLELPADKVRPAVQSYQGAAAMFEVSRAVSEGLKELSQREGVTLFMTLLAAFKVLLYRYTGQEDLSVGTLIANRTHADIENLIGFFVNTLVLRTDLSGAPGFRELLGRVRETALGAYAHQDVPFEKLVEELQPARDLSHTPLFQVLFVLQNALGDELRLPDLSVSPVKVETEIAKFDLSLFMMEQEEGLKGVLVYSTDLFERETIERLLGHFKILLEAIVREPQRAVTELPLLSEAEQHQLLVEWNETEVDERLDLCIHQLFEEQAARTPGATALVFEDERLSYAELNGRANQLAHHLQLLGVGPEVLVGILMERSLEMVVSLLAVLKAGGAYVPLDPQYPAERLAFMLEDSQVELLLAHRHLLEDLPQHSARVVCPAAARKEIALESEENPGVQITPEQLAYVIYTSGSTGRPKGSLINHSNVVRLFKSTEQWFHFDEHDVWTLFHSYAFDFSVWELWGALLYGGRLVIVPYLVSRSPEEFYELLCREQVTVLNQTPSAFHQLMLVEDSASSSKQLALRFVIFGGEALELQRLRPWFERHGDSQPLLVNMYGITETTVHVTYRPLTWSDLETTAGSIIGRPIPDLQVYLLDQHLQPVPQGIAGEIYVGGEGLARGYLHRPELTAERFIPNPFSTRPGARLYKSGDLARYLAQGELEYLGRIDHQVKIRGFRIELGEIESMLNAHPEIREAVVMAREDDPDEKRLVAYIVAEHEPPPKITQLREYLGEKLPEYMIPAAWVNLEELPLTANNKVDRRALPAPDTERPDLEDAFTSPRTPVEEMIAGIWCELLGLDRVGVYDNFFELGGHSLIATQLVSRLREAFQVEILLRNVFEQPTVAELAEALQKLEQKPGQVEILAELHKKIASMSPEQIRLALESKRGVARKVS